MGRKIVLLGSTGSIGTQTLDVVRSNPDELKVIALAPQPDRDVDIGNARGEKGRRDRERRQQEEKA